MAVVGCTATCGECRKIAEDAAGIARKHIAIEITTRMDAVEADGLDGPELTWWWRGMDDASRIAGGVTDG